MKLRLVTEDNQVVAYFFECPGCKVGHTPFVSPYRNPRGATWTFNGDLEKPTFSPSMLTNLEFADPTKDPIRCHLFVTDGMLRFLSDCTHPLAGQVVPMVEMEED